MENEKNEKRKSRIQARGLQAKLLQHWPWAEEDCANINNLPVQTFLSSSRRALVAYVNVSK